MAQVTLREYLQGIEDALGAGQVDDAAKECQHVLVQFPESLEVQRLLGEVYLAQGHIDEAQQALDWILTNDPENVIAYCDRALISERTSDFDTALDCYQQAYELSRGNRHIRQQFNMLSTKAGQQGFMFSRAGLARLYMRGGLLPQAVQEWDAVLTVSPDRLDARTGLLETYWREEMYDEAEQVALQTLQDVPGCVKALLILAHITAPKDMQQAKEYVQRAQMLDPDLSMAQELFEDMMMSQPGHPFLKLLSKAPTLVETSQSANKVLSPEPVFAQVPVSEGGVVVPDALLNSASTSNNPFDWNTLDTWNSGGSNTLAPDPRQRSMSDPSLPIWSHDIPANNEGLPLPEQTEQEQKSSSPQSSDSFQFDRWSMSPANNGSSAPEQQLPSWNDDMDHLTKLDSEPIWQQETTLTENANPSWLSAVQEASTPSAPPSWLSMLTAEEQKTSLQPDEVSVQPQPAPSAPHQAVEAKATNATADDVSWREALQSSLNTPEASTPAVAAPKVDDDDEEELSFGPAWLKSLGAAEMGADAPAQSEQPVQQSMDALTAAPEPPVASPEAISAVAEPKPSYDIRTAELETTPIAETQSTYTPYAWSDTQQAEQQPDTHDWSQYLSQEPQMGEQPEHNLPEHNLVHTLEGLEGSLRSQGFVPLEPNTLSAIAQSQGQELVVEEAQIPEEVSQHEEPYQTIYHDDATLSSALAQLGNLATTHTTPVYPVQEPLQPAAHETSMVDSTGEEPSWMSQLRSVPAPPHDVWSETQHTDPHSGEVPSKLTFDSMPIQQAEPQEQVYTVPDRVETLPAFEPSYAQPHNEVPLAPAARTDAFFENELETTMKRPAVRLQAMSQRTTAPLGPQMANRNGDGRSTGASRNTTRSFQERLIKGYQHQLVGDYDEAMQEYRVIVKSAPELLDDVVSNVRALLKLAPNYSAGYRVLGDAYMRQGEYLQAMEAYNKALTMAKKAKV